MISHKNEEVMKKIVLTLALLTVNQALFSAPIDNFNNAYNAYKSSPSMATADAVISAYRALKIPGQVSFALKKIQADGTLSEVLSGGGVRTPSVPQVAGASVEQVNELRSALATLTDESKRVETQLKEYKDKLIEVSKTVPSVNKTEITKLISDVDKDIAQVSTIVDAVNSAANSALTQASSNSVEAADVEVKAATEALSSIEQQAETNSVIVTESAVLPPPITLPDIVPALQEAGETPERELIKQLNIAKLLIKQSLTRYDILVNRFVNELDLLVPSIKDDPSRLGELESAFKTAMKSFQASILNPLHELSNDVNGQKIPTSLQPHEYDNYLNIVKKYVERAVDLDNKLEANFRETYTKAHKTVDKIKFLKQRSEYGALIKTVSDRKSLLSALNKVIKTSDKLFKSFDTIDTAIQAKTRGAGGGEDKLVKAGKDFVMHYGNFIDIFLTKGFAGTKTFDAFLLEINNLYKKTEYTETNSNLYQEAGEIFSELDRSIKQYNGDFDRAASEIIQSFYSLVTLLMDHDKNAAAWAKLVKAKPGSNEMSATALVAYVNAINIFADGFKKLNKFSAVPNFASVKEWLTAAQTGKQAKDAAALLALSDSAVRGLSSDEIKGYKDNLMAEADINPAITLQAINKLLASGNPNLGDRWKNELTALASRLEPGYVAPTKPTTPPVAPTTPTTPLSAIDAVLAAADIATADKATAERYKGVLLAAVNNPEGKEGQIKTALEELLRNPNIDPIEKGNIQSNIDIL
jgi:hypothetical protein